VVLGAATLGGGPISVRAGGFRAGAGAKSGMFQLMGAPA